MPHDPETKQQLTRNPLQVKKVRCAAIRFVGGNLFRILSSYFSVDASKKRSPVIIPEGKPSGGQAAASASSSSSSKTTRREELLKQLRAVEDAIARKRSKIT